MPIASRLPARMGWFKFAAFLLLIVLCAMQVAPALAATPEEDLSRINTNIEKSLAAARTGNLVEANRLYKVYDDAWFEVEEGVRTRSKETYKAIEVKMRAVEDALAKNPADSASVIATLEALDQTNEAFSKGTPATAPAADATKAASNANVATLLEKLGEARTLMAKGEWAGAATEIKEFQEVWPDVEGQVKTRSADAYTLTETDMALAYNLLEAKSPEARAVLERMTTRLEPYKDAASYGIFDATAILLREGLEALLVVVALLTFLKKSGNSDKQPWIWLGVGAGLLVSIALALGIQLVFSSAINASNRELIEGSVGLVAAVMLLYVSYWMHSKSSAASWQRYIKQRSTAALASGSVAGLALLAFLAIFREGAETALFYLGIGPSITLSDLLIGIGIAAVVLVGLGILMVVVGLRLPIGPFFRVASLLVFFLCFKFIGMGVHALQIAKVLPSTSETYLPQNGFLGMYPTWETTLAQLALLLVGLGVLLWGRFRNAKEVAPAEAPERETVGSVR